MKAIKYLTCIFFIKLFSQNYLNPFNQTTTTQFRISKFEFVNLKVYYALGNEIITLVHEEKPADTYRVDFSVEQESFPVLPRGVYFYQLKVYPANSGAGNFIDIKKMVLIM